MLRNQAYYVIGLLLALALMGYTKLAGFTEGGEGGQPLLTAGSYYRALLPQTPAFDIQAILEGAKRLGFWIRIQEGFVVTYFKGGELCKSCDPLKEPEFFKTPSLYLDTGLFLIRIDEPKLFFNVRPPIEAKGNYEIIANPKVNLEAKEAGGIIVGKLLKLGVLGSAIPLSFELLKLQDKPIPPTGLPLDSVLYELTQAPDWHTFAARSNIELSGMRVRVLIELKSPDAQLKFANLLIEARSASGLIRALVPIPELIELAKDPAVKLVRLPSKPQASI